MKSSMFAFGDGSRTRIGENVRSFDVSPSFTIRALLLVFLDREWVVHNAWFVKQSDFA